MCDRLKVIIIQGQSCLVKSTLCRKLSGIISDCTYLCVDKYKEKNWDYYGFDSVEERQELSDFSKMEFLLDLKKHIKEAVSGSTIIVDYSFHNTFWDSLMRIISDKPNIEIITIFLHPANEKEWEKAWRERSVDFSIRHPGHGATQYSDGKGEGYVTDFNEIKVDGLPVAGRVKKIAIDYHPNYSMHCSLMEIIQFIEEHN